MKISRRTASLSVAVPLAAVLLVYVVWPIAQPYVDPNGDPRAYPGSTTMSLASAVRRDGMTLPPTTTDLRFKTGSYLAGYPDDFLLKFSTDAAGLNAFLSSNTVLCGPKLTESDITTDGVQIDVKSSMGWVYPLYHQGVYGCEGATTTGRLFKMNVDDRMTQSPTIYYFSEEDDGPG